MQYLNGRGYLKDSWQKTICWRSLVVWITKKLDRTSCQRQVCPLCPHQRNFFMQWVAVKIKTPNGQHAENECLRNAQPHLGHLHYVCPPRLREYHRRGSRKIVRASSQVGPEPNSGVWTWQDHCTKELSVLWVPTLYLHKISSINTPAHMEEKLLSPHPSWGTTDS